MDRVVKLPNFLTENGPASRDFAGKEAAPSCESASLQAKLRNQRKEEALGPRRHTTSSSSLSPSLSDDDVSCAFSSSICSKTPLCCCSCATSTTLTACSTAAQAVSFCCEDTWNGALSNPRHEPQCLPVFLICLCRCLSLASTCTGDMSLLYHSNGWVAAVVVVVTTAFFSTPPQYISTIGQTCDFAEVFLFFSFYSVRGDIDIGAHATPITTASHNSRRRGWIHQQVLQGEQGRAPPLAPKQSGP